MIHIDRSRIEKPHELDPQQNPRLAQAMLDAENFFKYSEEERGQIRFYFDSIYSNQNVKNALNELFHGKCAYCESKIERITSANVEHYRPKSSVLESPDHSGYWWLANEWENLLIACRSCSQGSYYSKGSRAGKQNRFPLQNESKRAFSPDDSLSEELPLILNPCLDEPEFHLIYTDDGMVVSNTEEGRATILILGLNREDLVYRRKEAIAEVKQHIKFFSQLSKSKKGEDHPDWKEALKILDEMIQTHQEYAGLKRQYVNAALEKNKGKTTAATRSLESNYVVTNELKEAVKSEYEDFYKHLEGLSVNLSVEQNKDYMLLEHNIEKIELTNIKTFKQQSFDFTESENGVAPWLMLLGENGTGKSTILKSLCMNLCDVNYFRSMMEEGFLEPVKFIRHKARKGVIKVWMTSKTKPRILELTKKMVKFTNTEGKSIELSLPLTEQNIDESIWQSPTFLLAYGATRLLPRSSKYEAKHIKSTFSRLDNLFNPFVPLANAEKWLLDLDKVLFRRAAIVLKDLLNMKDEEEVTRKNGIIQITINGTTESFKDLSDGYQSVIALTADILLLVMKRWKNPDEARGIVLLDEIGAHLHPRWKMRIVTSLRKALPNIQFIVSSHQPLCLRGLGKGEVILIRRDIDNSIEVITELPNPKEMRISQILTSVFGLSSTMDPELEAEYNRYYELRAMNKRTAEEEREMIDLQNTLNPDLLLGESVMEAVEYKVIKEKYNHYKNEKNLSNIDKLSEETLSAVQDLWGS